MQLELELEQALVALNKEQILLYPTDTVWGIGCDATSKKAISKIYKIKQREETKSLIILVDSFKMLKGYISKIPKQALDVLRDQIKPTTIIYNAPKNLADNLVAKDNTIAIRIVQDEFCQKLISEFGKPIVSTSANISGKPTPKSFKEIDTSILDAVDYVVNLHQEKTATQSSRIVKIKDDGEVEVIRD